MKYAIDNKIDILINDCSQDAKHVQRIQRNLNEQNIKIASNNIDQGVDYISKLQKDNNELKQKMVMEHKKPDIRGYDMQPIIQSVTRQVDEKYQLNLEELQKEIGKSAQIEW